MLSEKAVNLLRNYPTYKAAKHKLMFELNIKEFEADNLLFTELISNRFRHYDSDTIVKAIVSENKVFSWKITYTFMDIKHKHFSEIDKNRELKEKLKRENLSQVIKLNRPDKMQSSDIDKVIKLLPKIFKKSTIINFATSVLRFGKDETIAAFDLTAKLFNNRMSYIERYCKKHRQKLVNIVLSKEQAEMIEEKQIITESIECIESTEYTDDKFQDLFNEHYEYFDDLIGKIPMIHSPELLIDNFKEAMNLDKYKLINALYERYDFISNKVIEK